MAFLQRHLILNLAAALCLAFAVANTASSAEPPAPTFKALLLAKDQSVIGDLFYDVEKTPVGFFANTQRLSRAYPIPANGTVALYRLAPPVPPATLPTKVPVAEIKLAKGGPWLVLLNATQSAGVTTQLQTQVIDASLTAHPQSTVNIYNFCREPMAISVEEDVFTLSHGQSRLLPYPHSPKPSLWLKCAVRKQGDWSLETSSPQTIVPGNTRAIWLLYDLPGTRENPESTVAIRNLVEPLPAPEKTST
jgi:hypothetical protein